MITGDARRSTQPARRCLDPPRVIVAAIVVCVAYFLGAQLGLQLRLPGATPSVLWPPNALLTSALLLVPRRHWAVMVAGGVPAHLTLTIGTDWPGAMIGRLFLTNCGEALIGATLLRRFSDAPVVRFARAPVRVRRLGCARRAGRLELLRRRRRSSFSAESYWDVWRARTFANVLTAVTVVPAVTSVAGYLTSDEPWPPAAARAGVDRARGRIADHVVRHSVRRSEIHLHPGRGPGAPAFLLPFIAWAAVRFGTIGASVTVLMTALLAIVSAAHGNSPFFTLSPGETLIGVQFLILAAALPHLALAASIDERRHALDALAARLDFERLLGQLAHAFLAPPGTRRRGLPDCAPRRGRAAPPRRRPAVPARGLGAHRDGLWFRHDASPAAKKNRGPGFPGARERDFRQPRSARWQRRRLSHRRRRGSAIVHEPRLRIRLCDPARLRNRGLRLRIISVDRPPMQWDRHLVARLRLIAEIFRTATARQHAEAALVASETLKTAILSSLVSGVAVPRPRRRRHRHERALERRGARQRPGMGRRLARRGPAGAGPDGADPGGRTRRRGRTRRAVGRTAALRRAAPARHAARPAVLGGARFIRSIGPRAAR